jgi:class 3 adenylate cyclase/tetratricopeptide (TPR) repeat protein
VSVDKLAAIEGAIAALEAQRGLLGDSVVDTAIQPLVEQRALLADRPAVEQRKLVTVLFSDLVDFTVLSQQLDAEDVRTVVNAYFVRWNEHIEANGGVVEKFIGDAVMAVFGLHRAEEEDPHRAIRAALAMRSSLDELNAEFRTVHGFTLDMRVGIDTGDVVVSTLGERPGQDFVVVGETVNRASRLQGAAPRGGILVSADTYRHVRGSFAVQPLTGLQLKGIAHPVDGYIIESERARGFRLDDARGVEGVDTRTVGRGPEFRQLQDRYHDVAEERRWQVVTVVGDAGVGKSRLLSDFGRWLDDLPDPVWWFSGAAAHSGPSRPYALLHDLFAARFDIHDSDDPSEVMRKWELGVEHAFGTGPEAAEQAHVIALWLGFDVADSPALEGVSLAPQILADRATTLLGQYFRLLADKAPVVLLIEDLHWADEASLALVDAARGVLGDCRVLVVASTRPALMERHPHWGEGLDFHTRLPLEALSRRETRQLVSEILQRVDQVPQALSDLVVEASEGNPFYVEELVKWLLEAGVIVKDAEVWTVLEDRLEDVKVPSTLRSVIQARIDSLTAAERLALQRAAVIGRVFWDDAVDSLRAERDLALTAPDIATSDALDRLRGREVVYQREQSAFDHTREFLFKHALLRDVAYDGVLRRHRQTYHGLAARWFEQMAERTRRADEYAGLIADHYANAGDLEAAARWYLVAGQQAASVHGLADATRLLGQGLASVPDAATQLRFDLLLARESVLDRLGDRAAQQADLGVLDTLVTEIDDPGRRVRLLITRCRWAFHRSEYDVQEVAAQEAIALARAAGLEDLETEALLWRGKGLAWAGSHQAARDLLAEALSRARRLGLRKVVTEALRYLAIVASNVSEFPEAEALLQEAIAMHREDNDTEGESAELVQLATVLYNEGRFADSRECLERALPILISSGFRYREAVVVSNLGSIVLQQGELGLGRRLVTRGLELCLQLDDAEGVATALNLLGEVHRRVGQLDEATTHFSKSVERAASCGFDVVASDSLLALGLIATSEGRRDDALDFVDDAIERARRAESALCVARALVGRGYVMSDRGQAEEAAEALDEALAGAKRLGLSYLVTEAEALLARVALQRGDRDVARTLALRTLDRLGDPELLGALQSGDVYLACRDVLTVCSEPRAAEAIDAAHAYLRDMAARIDEDDLRGAFLQRVATNVALAR